MNCINIQRSSVSMFTNQDFSTTALQPPLEMTGDESSFFTYENRRLRGDAESGGLAIA